ncbi:cell division FtsA domain-containing protein [Candidatus Pelagibacter sp. Uisw_092]|jgi:cell division protein FtsA|uniref:cell division FtsA domain-containing protein n=1 Tax=Candidatus Pelagibacter sp. Uisw_092 TaxID=3230979 RepID=UPI0039ED0F7C
MTNKKFLTIFDCGFSRIRAGTFNLENKDKTFFIESNFISDSSNLKLEIQKIITSLERNTNEYIDNIDLMVDSTKMLSIGISISKKIEESKLRQDNILFMVQEAKQLILKHYSKHTVAHIIINNYKIDNIDYSDLPDEIECKFISLDIIFICLPSELIVNLKNIFSESNILVNQVICSSYAKSMNYKNDLNLTGEVSFIDIGFKKTSILSYIDDRFISLDVLPVGGNHITKDISLILKIDLNQAEQLKLNFDKTNKHLNNENFSIEMIQKIAFARTEEILELCTKSLESNAQMLGHFKMILMGEGSKILDNKFKDMISFSRDIDFLEETFKDVCNSGFKLRAGPNKQEVVVVPKKLLKQGFFEKLFHFFR